MERVWKSASMEKLAATVIAENMEDFAWITREGIAFAFLESNVEKKKEGRRVFGECRKADANLKEIGNCDFVIKFYEPNTRYMTDRQKYILMHHELLHASAKNTDECSIVPHDYVVGEFKKIIDKYGLDWAAVREEPEEQEDENV
jgi:hypothetical protein